MECLLERRVCGNNTCGLPAIHGSLRTANGTTSTGVSSEYDFLTFFANPFSFDGQTRASVKQVFLFLSGNPGMPFLYEAFLAHIQVAFPDMLVMCLGYPGMSTVDPSPKLTEFREPDHSIDDHISVAAQFLQHMLAQFPSAGFILGGHSFGCYAIVELLRRNAVDCSALLNVLFVCPTLRRVKKRAPLGVRFMALPGVRESVATLAWTLGQLPRSLLRGLDFLFRAESDSPKAFDGFLKYSVVRSTLRLAKDEFDCIVEMDTDVLTEMGEKLIVLITKNDSWVLEEDRARLRSEARKVGATYLGPLDGDHTLIFENSELAKQCVIPVLRQRLQSQTRKRTE
eukprot:ANDGO_08475.mRNA.1 hypothetical protein PTSG_05151